MESDALTGGAQKRGRVFPALFFSPFLQEDPSGFDNCFNYV